MKTILLVSMPWARADMPSLQLGILLAYLNKSKIRARVFHAAPLLEKKLGAALYWRVANNIHPLLAEAIFNVDNSDADALREALLYCEEFTVYEIEEILRGASWFLGELNALRPWRGFDAVGFSCTFNQLQASLRAAAMAKEAGCRTVFGGFLASGTLAQPLFRHPMVDAIIDGPGEETLPVWMASGCPPGIHKGVIGVHCARETPDFMDFFSGLDSWKKPSATLVIEASRGCEHGGCAFCSQNHQRPRREHGAEFVAKCLRKYENLLPTCGLEFADTSLPLNADFLSKISLKRSGGKSWRAFAECRAPSITQMRNLHRAGFDNLQVGIESLQPDILRRMNKNATLLDNICCLRESWRYGIKLVYNIILDMPGTTEKEIEETLSLLPALVHLPPPVALVPFCLQKESPVFKAPGRFGLKNIRPHRWHKWLDPDFPPFFFEFDNSARLPQSLTRYAHECFMHWRESFNAAKPLFSVDFYKNGAYLADNRKNISKTYELDKDEANILKICRRPTCADALTMLNIDTCLIERLAHMGALLKCDNAFLTLPAMTWNGAAFPPQPESDFMDSFFA